ncbi:cardiolipin synthase [Metabacillus rhizolycopersici]|uniref:Cardiolipin synthase n=1 Tax=Metabacillus rhizolycopersici TaxID=2875709 RepID=A0ABS7ULG1_9BACI|nr:cardiolipin synthase [Metabacillus rhizolycopersici]MBZ5749153.1 cardiolipin synthase [Metabacillus rhizolycopersici]
MTIFMIIGIIIVALICWFTIDYHLGRKNHLSTSNYTPFLPKKSDIELFTDGENLFQDLFESIRNSTQSIHVLFYIVQNDQISNEFLSLLGEKASQGIKVRLLLDYIGSIELDKQKIKKLREKGVKFARAHSPRFPYLFYTLQARNHRKITVIDGEIGYLGGFNIGKEYIGHDPKFGFWRDYHLKITGEGVSDLQQQFLKDWYEATAENHLEDRQFFPEQQAGKSTQMFISTYGEHLDNHFKELIRDAKQEIIICSPYFIPGKEILYELLDALAKGVMVKIMVPMKADHPLVKQAAFPYFGKLLLAGCEIYRYYHGFYHAKVIVIDDHACDIGTANFDKRSLYVNDEMTCLIYDQNFVRYVKEQIAEDFHTSELLTYDFYRKRSFLHRCKEAVASLVSHFL